MNLELKKIIEGKVKEYYTAYYRDTLGLKDYEARVSARLKEDETFDEKLRRIVKNIPFFYLPKNGKKVLVIGAGTGRDFFSLINLGYDVYAIEPDNAAYEILRLKCEYHGIEASKISKQIIEELHFENNTFDFVWSWTVLEHVNDIKLSIHQMLRVLKPNGWAFMEMPNYSQLYEPHYKMHLPLFLPVFVLRFLLFLKRRPTRYISNGINYIKINQVRRILRSTGYPVDASLMYWPINKAPSKGIIKSINFFLVRRLGWVKNQMWIIRKHGNNDYFA